MAARGGFWLRLKASLGRSVGLAVVLTSACSSTIKDDETVLLFPTAAHLDRPTGTWVIPVHGWVFEGEGDSLWRNGLMLGAAAGLGLDPDSEENPFFRRRAWMFLVDNERGKDLEVSIGGQAAAVGGTGANGHAMGTLRVDAAEFSDVASDGWVEIEAILPAGDQRRFSGGVQLLASEGVSVISDIDDTIKISDVTDKQALLANTFLRAFRPAPGMAELYGRWAESGVAFHYVSSSPWQLFPALDRFLGREAFPRGSFHLKQFRLKDESFFSLFQEGEAHKIPVIESILAAFPGRRFILVGDSGERDPEIYGEIARRHPSQIARIFIRDVTDQAQRPDRLEAAFAGLQPDLWTLFADPAALADFGILLDGVRP